MPLLNDWMGYHEELKSELRKAKEQHGNLPLEAVALLKTEDLRDILIAADKAEEKGDADAMRKLLGPAQKFFLKFAPKFKAAKDACKEANLLDLNDYLNTFLVYVTRTQKAVALLGSKMLDDAQQSATTDKKQREIAIKKILAPIKLKTDWKEGKKDFENATGKKKPSEKILAGFRKSTGVEDALDALDSACEKADPAKYRTAYAKFVDAKDDYLVVLNKALASDKAADEIYKKKCDGLKDLLSSIAGRAAERITSLNNLDE